MSGRGHDGDDDEGDEDTRAILARRRRFIASALAGLALTGCGEAMPQPCLSVDAAVSDAPPQPCLSRGDSSVPDAPPQPCLSADGSPRDSAPDATVDAGAPDASIPDGGDDR